METRYIAVAAAVLATALAGCGSPPAALGGTTAKVTIDGRDTGNPHAVRCSQTGWAWTIETPDKTKGFTAVIDIGDFTGTYWGEIVKAEVSGAGGKYTITGSAAGNFTDNPSKEVTTTFRIEASC